LLKQMTLEEKVGQMAQVSIESLGSGRGGQFSFTEKLKDAVVNYKIGSILNSPGPCSLSVTGTGLLLKYRKGQKKQD
jgi:hypothetical protein